MQPWSHGPCGATFWFTGGDMWLPSGSTFQLRLQTNWSWPKLIFQRVPTPILTHIPYWIDRKLYLNWLVPSWTELGTAQPQLVDSNGFKYYNQPQSLCWAFLRHLSKYLQKVFQTSQASCKYRETVNKKQKNVKNSALLSLWSACLRLGCVCVLGRGGPQIFFDLF